MRGVSHSAISCSSSMRGEMGVAELVLRSRMQISTMASSCKNTSCLDMTQSC